MRKLIDLMETMAFDDEKKKRFAEKLGALIRQEREKNGMTTHQLSVLTGKSESCIYKIEHAQTKPSFETIVCICLALDLQIENVLPPGIL